MEREIYQDIVLDHFRAPRLKQQLEESDEGVVTVRNPNCGDVVLLRAEVLEGETLRWVQHAQGCAASVASTSVLCEHLDGMKQKDAEALVDSFIDALESENLPGSSLIDDDIELQALLYFRNVPARKLCVSLAWSAAKKALAAQSAAE